MLDFINFNPRSHEGSDSPPFVQTLFPPNFNPRSHEGSDDRRQCSLQVSLPISIHAPTRGATISPVGSSSPQVFQSTLPRGERRHLHSRKHGTDGISIHAPTRGATCKNQTKASNKWKFQSTLPRGERHRVPPGNQRHINFNPRSHEGSDQHLADLGIIQIRFQSTLPRGERRDTTTATQASRYISIHAPTRGATTRDL